MARRLLLPLPACHQGVHARLRRAMERVGVRGLFRESELVEGPLIPTFSPQAERRSTSAAAICDRPPACRERRRSPQRRKILTKRVDLWDGCRQIGGSSSQHAPPPPAAARGAAGGPP